MLEIILIVLSVTINNRFKQAGQTGAKKYILPIWMVYLGAFLLAVIIGGIAASSGSDGAMLFAVYFFLLVGYIIEIIIACRGMSYSKRLLQNMPQQNYGMGYQQGWGQQQPYQPQYAPVQQPQPQYAPNSGYGNQSANANDLMSALSLANGAIGFSSSGSSAAALSNMGFTVRDFRSETEKQAEKNAHLPLEPELEGYANEIADAFANYDGSSVYSESPTKSRIRPIGEKLNDNDKQLRVFHRAVAIAASRGIRISSSTMERFWEGCGGWQV